MGIEERKNREKEERRALILGKAKELVLERGVVALTMQDIAEASELSKATLYLYFQSKEAILMDIMEEAALAFVEFAQSRISENSSGLEALHALWASYLTLFGESQDVIVLTGIKNYIDPGFPLIADAQNSRMYESNMKMVTLIASVLKRGVADGTLEKSLDPEQLARTVIMIATSIIDAVAKIPRPQRDARLIRTEMCRTFEILLRGLAAEGSDRSLLVLSSGSNPEHPSNKI
ncbi:MAG TPA: TetR/AcrR family transcriptional regulator [Rectinemataceae bacterium]|nr:TetR/AcrR family transcriptional regulator [Rectinemataceae bacterium]